MVRTAQFTPAAFVQAAMELVAQGGPAAASMSAIARKVGAPNGSIYHRFSSRAAILLSAWNAAYSSFVEVVAAPLRAGRARDAAIAIVDWAAADNCRARFLLLNDAESVFADLAPPDDLLITLRRLEDELDTAFQVCLAGIAGNENLPDDEITTRAKFLIFDAPIALLRTPLQASSPIPAVVRNIVAEMHATIAIVGSERRAGAPRLIA
jgi:AcrR family transcriptional regulator